jgi:phosphate transport system substrate-binding protein
MLDQLHSLRAIGGKAALALVLGATLAVAACGGTSSSPGTGATCPSTTSLTGAGSSFAAPLFSAMFPAYAQQGCHVQVNYQAVGSGAGINQLLAQTVDFGATDAPMKDSQLAQSTNGPIIHIAATIGAVAISYNLSQVDASVHLKLTGPVLANIFLGTVKFWDDPAIAQLNTGTTLPHVAIHVVHRSDGSGTTGIFTNYLKAVSPAWASGPGAGTTINWPTGVGAAKNAGVAAAVKATAGAIGYNELAYVLTNSIQYAQIQNANGDWVLPSLDSAKAAANNFTNIPADLRVYIVNAPGSGSYPITGYTWAIVYQNQSNSDKGQALASLLWWMVHDGQQFSTPQNYVPLAATIVSIDETQIKSMKCGSSACYKG